MNRTCFVCKKAEGAIFVSRHTGCTPPGSAREVPRGPHNERLLDAEIAEFNAHPEATRLWNCEPCFNSLVNPELR